MIIEYRYRNTRGVHGWFQCDREDFLHMFHNTKFREVLYWIDVKIFNKNTGDIRKYHFTEGDRWYQLS